MAKAPNSRPYKRGPRGLGRPVGRYVPNPAGHLTNQAADPEPDDLAWQIRRTWRVIFYTARQSAGQPLWGEARDFEWVMSEVLLQLSWDFEPVEPPRRTKVAPARGRPADPFPNRGRTLRSSTRVFPMPLLPEPEPEP